MSANLRNAGYLSILSFGLLATACDQPAPKCSIARGAFAARYTLVSGTGECAMLTGELLGVDVYYQPISKSDPQADTKNGFVAIQPDSLTYLLGGAAGRAEANPEDKPYAMGQFQKQEPTDDFCMLPSAAPARVRLPELAPVDDMCNPLPGEPAVDISYTWSNVKVYVTPDAYGTQFAADLTYTKDGCTAQYRVTAVYPATSCAVEVTPEAPAPATDPDGGTSDAGMSQGMDASSDMDAAEPESEDGSVGDIEDDGACPAAEEAKPVIADDTLCKPFSDPNVSAVCDPVLLHCLLTSEPPSSR